MIIYAGRVQIRPSLRENPLCMKIIITRRLIFNAAAVCSALWEKNIILFNRQTHTHTRIQIFTQVTRGINKNYFRVRQKEGVARTLSEMVCRI